MSTLIPVPTPPEHISSDEWWDVNGVSLSQFGWNVETIGGSRYDMPTKRGNNRMYPYRPGTRHNKNKMAEEREVQLNMWVQATHPGTNQLDGDMKTRFNDSWNFIRELFWSWSGVQLVLTRRWWQTIQGVRVLHKASALVEMTDAMPPTMQGRFHATFQVKLLMASPFFYGDEIVETFQSGETRSIWNPGQDRAMFEHMTVQFYGPLWKPWIVNATPDPDVQVRYAAGITGSVIINVPDFLCFDTNNNNVIRYIQPKGARFWFGLVPGANLVSFIETYAGSPSGSHGGYATITYRPTFL